MTADQKEQLPQEREPHILLVQKLQSYDTLSVEERRVLQEAISGTRTFDAGQDLVKVDDRPSFSTVLTEGWAARYKTLENGSRQITAIHVPGDFVDLHSFLIHKMDHSVTALSECRIATVPHTELRLVSERHPHLTRLLWLATLVDAAIHRNRIVIMGRMPAVNNLANLLCELYLRLKAVDMTDELQFEIPLRQSDVADVLGLTTVHVNRIVQDLRARELISWQARTLTINNWDEMVALAEFDPTYLSQMSEAR